MSEASAAAQLPEEVRRVVWRHAVDLYAYFGKPVEQLSREQIALWLGLRAEWKRLSEADAALLDGHGQPWGRTPKPGVQDPQNWIAKRDADGNVVGYIRVRHDRAAEDGAALEAFQAQMQQNSETLRRGIGASVDVSVTNLPATDGATETVRGSKLASREPLELDITPSWWRARHLYADGAAVLAALASPELESELKGCGTEVSVSIDGVTLRYLRLKDTTDKVLRRQRLAIMEALEAARPDAPLTGSMSFDVATEQIRKTLGLASLDIAAAAAPLKPLTLREELKSILLRHPPASALTAIAQLIEACGCNFAARGDGEGWRVAAQDAATVRAAVASLSQLAWKTVDQ